MNYFANALAKVLEHTTTTELALSSGLSQSTISLYQNGHRIPTRENLDRLTNAMTMFEDRWAVSQAYILDLCPSEFLDIIAKLLLQVNFPKEVRESPAPYAFDKNLAAAVDKLKIKAEGNHLLKNFIIELARRW